MSDKCITTQLILLNLTCIEAYMCMFKNANVYKNQRFMNELLLSQA